MIRDIIRSSLFETTDSVRIIQRQLENSEDRQQSKAAGTSNIKLLFVRPQYKKEPVKVMISPLTVTNTEIIILDSMYFHRCMPETAMMSCMLSTISCLVAGSTILIVPYRLRKTVAILTNRTTSSTFSKNLYCSKIIAPERRNKLIMFSKWNFATLISFFIKLVSGLLPVTCMLYRFIFDLEKCFEYLFSKTMSATIKSNTIALDNRI